MFRRNSWQTVLGLTVICGAAAAASATTHNVDVGGAASSFAPADLTIQLGDTVHWVWMGGFHNVESGVGGTHDGNFRSGDPTGTNGTTFDVTFDQAFLTAHPMAMNQYPYYCAVHFGAGMVGTVTVEEPIDCPADITDNGSTNMPDGNINVFDLLLLLTNWNTNGTGADIAAPTDTVDVFDLLALLGTWGTCS